MSTWHCGDCGSELCGHGACPQCNPCGECDGGDRSNKRFEEDDYFADREMDIDPILYGEDIGNK